MIDINTKKTRKVWQRYELNFVPLPTETTNKIIDN